MKRNANRGDQPLLLLCYALLLGSSLACTTTTTTVSKQTEQPRGFFARLMDQITERECNVGKFSCPYGFGSAGEPCECTDPKGVVLKGLTIK